MEGLGRKLDVPPAVWLVPLGTAVAAVVTWTVWCDSPTGAWVGAAFVVLTALLVISLLVEGLPHHPGWRNRLKRLAIAVVVARRGHDHLRRRLPRAVPPLPILLVVLTTQVRDTADGWPTAD